MFPGPRVKMTIKLTEVARKIVTETQAALVRRGQEHATEAATVEWLVRSAVGAPMN